MGWIYIAKGMIVATAVVDQTVNYCHSLQQTAVTFALHKKNNTNQ